MPDILLSIGEGASAVIAVITCLTLIVRPLREKVLGVTAQKEAMRCLLRNEITSIYYRHIDRGELRQFEFENLTRLYQAYRRLGGNSFVEKIFAEMRDEWGIIK